MQDEKGLVEGAKRGDPQAFARLYEEYFDRIYRYVAVRVGGGAVAEDITEEVFLKMIESIASFRWRGVPFSAWLFRIAHNQVVDHLRRAARRPSVGLSESIIAADDDPETIAEHSMSIEQVNVAIECLTKNQRDVIALRFAAGLSIAEVAVVMDRREGAVKALQHSALVALRKRLAGGQDDE
ncbi:MAG: sigma-70 family RNA polymerase sigma factor [Chloroflexota bacterium]|nr:sigma-70 family RNA polymerase sigma factor [Chloroflexota bacterium]